MRRKIEIAVDNKRNIIPLMMEGFDFGSIATVNALTGKLAKLKKYNGIGIPAEYFDEAMLKLRSDKFLNRPLESVVHPVSEITARITEVQKSAANVAPPVEKEELIALEWIERGYIFHEQKNFDEAIRCYSEAIRLKPDFAEAYYNRGNGQNDKGSLDSAIKDYNTAIHLKPDYAEAYNNRGEARRRKGELDSAIADFTISIKLENSDLHLPYNNRGAAHSDKNYLDGAMADYNQAIYLKPDFAVAYLNRASIWEKKRDYSYAIADYQKYLAFGGGEQFGNQQEFENKVKNLKSKLTKKKSTKKKPR